MEMDNARLIASDLVSLSIIPAALASLARLNIFEALADGAQLTATELAELAAEKPLNAALLSRLLRLMACENVFTEELTPRGDRRFGLTPLGKLFVEDPENGSFAGMLQWTLYPDCMRAWDHLHEFLVDDSVTPFQRANRGLNPWEYGQQNSEFNDMINKAMGGTTKFYMRSILDEYTSGFDDVKVLVDVGGGAGTSLELITKRYPHIKGVNFDMPQVVAACPDIPRVEHVGGDFRESVPAVGDAIFLKFVLHNWDEKTCVLILRNCFEALPASGKAIVVDTMLPEGAASGADDSLPFKMDVIMMNTFGSNARERTEGEFRKLAMDAGFQRMDVICKVDHAFVMEFHKT